MYHIFNYLLLLAFLLNASLTAFEVRKIAHCTIYSGDSSPEYRIFRVNEDLSYEVGELFEKVTQIETSKDESKTQEIAKKTNELLKKSDQHLITFYEKLKDYVDPDHLPNNISFQLGFLFAIKGTYSADPQKYYNISLRLFARGLDLEQTSPDVFRNKDLECESYVPDEALWAEALQKSDKELFDRIFRSLRFMVHFYRQNKETPLADRLSLIMAKMVFDANKDSSFSLDAVHAWLFKLYIDLEEGNPLFKAVEEECLKWMPEGIQCDDLKAENEFWVLEKVRMRNLLKTSQVDREEVEEIIEELGFCEVEARCLLINFLHFFKLRAGWAEGYRDNDGLYNATTNQIYNYLSGYIELKDIPITEENALDYLFQIKVFDVGMALWNSNYPVKIAYTSIMNFQFKGFNRFHFPRSSYELRKHILKLKSNLASYEAFTLSINPNNICDEKEEASEGAWNAESEKLRQTCIDDLMKAALYLSKIMEDSVLQGKIIGTRGISGSGKSTFLKKNILPLLLPEQERTEETIDILAKGILNPDTLKAHLKKLQGDTLNTQVHEEASSAFKQLFKEVADKNSYILDKRLITAHAIRTNLVDPGFKQGQAVWLFDFDIPLSTSLIRILTRTLHEDDPCPACDALIDGFISLRKNRKQVIQLAIGEEIVTKYELYATSKQCLVAEKRENTLYIHDPALFEESLRELSPHAIEEELSQVIDDALINKIIERGDIDPKKLPFIEKWRGMTLKRAAKCHIHGESCYDESLLEVGTKLPFKEDWLKSLPQVLDFVHSEHLSRLHEDDDMSCYMMKLGYFIIPWENIDATMLKYKFTVVPWNNFKLEGDDIPSTLAKSLSVADENGEIYGLRFFVHPLAYAHFAPLLEAGIAFVPPSRSEFIGTPISSYGSWLIRGQLDGCYEAPFILKMGMPKGVSDIKNLLSVDTVIRSIRIQRSLDKLPENKDFLFFNERFGMVLKEIPGYPAGTISSGVIISELPKSVLDGECKLVSLPALMSKKTPLIHELIETAVEKGLVEGAKDFLKTYFLKPIEPKLVNNKGYSLTGKGENLYVLLNLDNTINAFAYRDFKTLKFMKTVVGKSWFEVILEALQLEEPELQEEIENADLKDYMLL